MPLIDRQTDRQTHTKYPTLLTVQKQWRIHDFMVARMLSPSLLPFLVFRI